MTDISNWPITTQPDTEKERQIAKVLFETEGFVPTDRLAAIAGNKELAVKYISALRRKLEPGYKLERSGTGYQIMHPAPPIAPADIKPDQVPLLIALDVVNSRLQADCKPTMKTSPSKWHTLTMNRQPSCSAGSSLNLNAKRSNTQCWAWLKSWYQPIAAPITRLTDYYHLE